MYLASARCDKHYKSYSTTNKNAKMSNYYSNQDLTCQFIQSVVEGNYNELGFVNVNLANYTESSGNVLTNNIYYEEYGHYVQEVSSLQVFGLVSSLFACAILGTWAVALARSLTPGKAQWRPRRGVSNVLAPSAGAVERHDSGIVLGRSATMERGRSTSSYYMT